MACTGGVYMEGYTGRGTPTRVQARKSQIPAEKSDSGQECQIAARNFRSRPGISVLGQEYQYSDKDFSTRPGIFKAWFKACFRPLLAATALFGFSPLFCFSLLLPS